MLLPAKFQPEAIPTLGALVREAIAPKPDPIKAFETGDHSLKPVWIGYDMAVTSGDQTAGKYTITVDGNVTVGGSFTIATPSPISKPEPKFKVGDRVRMTHREGKVADGRIVCASSTFPGEWLCQADGHNEPTGIFEPWQLELIPPAPSVDGWIEWRGGECPIPLAAAGEFEIRYRDATDDDGYLSPKETDAKHFTWKRSTRDCESDIVAFKLVKP